MKYIIRTLLIIFVAGLVCGGLYLFSKTDAATAITPERGEHGRGANFGLQTGENVEDGEHHFRGGGGEEQHRWGERDGSGDGNGATEGAPSFGEGFGGNHHEDSLSLTSLLEGLGKHTILVVFVALVIASIQKIAGMVGGKQKKSVPSAS